MDATNLLKVRSVDEDGNQFLSSTKIAHHVENIQSELDRL